MDGYNFEPSNKQEHEDRNHDPDDPDDPDDHECP